MKDEGPTKEADASGGAAHQDRPSEQLNERMRRVLLYQARRHPIVMSAIGMRAVYRVAGGGLVASGLAYATLLALVPMLVLVVGGLALIVDEQTRSSAIEVIATAVPALRNFLASAVSGATELAAIGSIVALVGFGWAASGLYVNLTRAMERFFPGELVSGALARIAGVVLVVLVVIGVLAVVIAGGVLSALADALAIDRSWLLSLAGAGATLAVAFGIAYSVYRVMPAAPPSPESTRLPALLAGIAIGLMTMFYGLISQWLTYAFEAYGVAASFFVTLVWLRVVFVALTYGAAMARYRDEVMVARLSGAAEPAIAATDRILGAEAERARAGHEFAEVIEAARSSDAD